MGSDNSKSYVDSFSKAQYGRAILNKKKGATMGEKKVNVPSAILVGLGILILLAAGFDIFPAQDNVLVFSGIACFIIAGVIRKISGGGCCK